MLPGQIPHSGATKIGAEDQLVCGRLLGRIEFGHESGDRNAPEDTRTLVGLLACIGTQRKPSGRTGATRNEHLASVHRDIDGAIARSYEATYLETITSEIGRID